MKCSQSAILFLLISLSSCAGNKPEAPVVVLAKRDARPAAVIHSRVHRRPGRLGPFGGTLGLRDRIEYPEVPQVYHPEVKNFIRYYTTTRRSYVEEALVRRAKYLPVIEPILRRYGLPEELANIAFIESRFIPDARYKDGSTVGMWQLSRPTAKNYGLSVKAGNDERKNVERSTEAAARFLASLYDSFGDWYLAAAAYNSGPVRVQRALDKAGKSIDVHRLDFFELTARGILSKTTREFVAKFGALVIITSDLERYGFTEPAKER